MKSFIPNEKLSKRERRARDAARRVTWDISPVTRRPENPRAYKREKTRKCIEDALSVSLLAFRKNHLKRFFDIFDIHRA